MIYLECIDPGKSGWLEGGKSYEALGWNRTCYWVRREGYPHGKMYSKKHFVEVQPSFKQKLKAAVGIVFA